MTHICYVCRENNDLLHKICSCASSYICTDCLKLTEDNINQPDNMNENRFKCQICRENLTLTMSPNFRYYQSLSKFYFLKFIFFFTDILPLLYIYEFEHPKTIYPTHFYTSRNHFLFTNLFHVILLKNAAKMLLSQMYKIPDKIEFNYALDMLYLIASFLLFGICFIHTKTQFIDLYTIVILFFCYYFPFLIVSLMCILNNLGEVIKHIRRENQEARITILGHYYNPYGITEENEV